MLWYRLTLPAPIVFKADALLSGRRRIERIDRQSIQKAVVQPFPPSRRRQLRLVSSLINSAKWLIA